MVVNVRHASAATLIMCWKRIGPVRSKANAVLTQHGRKALSVYTLGAASTPTLGYVLLGPPMEGFHGIAAL